MTKKKKERKKCAWCKSTKTGRTTSIGRSKRTYKNWIPLHGFIICTKCYSKMKFNIKKQDNSREL